MAKQSIDRNIYNSIKNWTKLKPENCIEKMKEFLETVKPFSKRTSSQNSALHLYFSQVASELEREGHTLQDVIKHINKVEITPTMSNVKEIIWKEIQKVVLNKKSTTELAKQEDIEKVYDVMNKWLGTYFQIYIPFPNDPDPAPLKDKNYA